MNRYYYDLHIHSCLSPCGDNDNTPNNIAGMASICGLNIAALTDHNSCKNCPAFFEAAKRYGIIPVAGMELTTSEDIHVLCLFEQLEEAMRFDEEIGRHRMLVPNRADIFGDQLILDGEDNVIGTEEHYLPNATDISLEDVPALVSRFGGVCAPAHIDRPSNGVIAVLGVFPETPHFDIVEFNLPENREEYVSRYSLEDKIVLIDSDAHYLTNIRDREHYFELDDEPYSSALVRHNLFRLLRKET